MIRGDRPAHEEESIQRMADLFLPYLDAYEAEKEIKGEPDFNAVVDVRGLSLFLARLVAGWQQ